MSEGREGRNLKRREAMKKWKAVLAVFLSVVLVLQSSNIQALADVIDGDGESGREEIVLDKPAEETEPSESTDEQKDTPPASEPKKEEPAEPAEPATPEEPAEKKDDSTKKDEPTQTTEPVEKAEETKPAEETEPAQTTEPSKETSSSTADKTSSPETEDTTATLKFDVTGATLTYNQDGEKNVTAATADKTVELDSTLDFKFTVSPDDGQQIASVKAVTSDGAESDVTANESGEYTLPAANVIDGTTIKVTTEAVPAEEPETPAEGTGETDTPVTDDTTAEDEEAAESEETTETEQAPTATTNSLTSADNGISLMAPRADADLTLEVGKSGTLRGSDSTSIINPWHRWEVVEGEGYVSLSNTYSQTVTVHGNEPGTAVLRHTYSTFLGGQGSEDFTVQVGTPASVSVEPAAITIEEGQTGQLTATVSPQGGSVEWSSSNTNIATVDQDGTVTAVRQGTAYITARIGGSSASALVTVTPKPAYRIVYNSNYPADALKLSYNNGSGTIETVPAENTNAVYQYEPGSRATIIDAIACANYSFLGWSTDQSAEEGDVAYAPGTEVQVEGNLTLYAVWGNKVEYEDEEQVVVRYRYNNREFYRNVTAPYYWEGNTKVYAVVLANNQDTFAADDSSFRGWQHNGETYSFNETLVTSDYRNSRVDFDNNDMGIHIHGRYNVIDVSAWLDDSATYAQFFVLKRSPDPEVGANSGNYYSVGTGTIDTNLIDRYPYPNGEDKSDNDVSSVIVTEPDAATIADILSIPLSETENIRWYVIKDQGDGYHVDGIIYDMSKFWNVRFVDQGEVVGDYTVQDGSSLADELIPVPKGQDFEYWTLADGTRVNLDEVLTQVSYDVTLYAKYKDRYTVSGSFVDSNGEPVEGGTITNNGQSVVANGSSRAMEFTTPEGYVISSITVNGSGATGDNAGKTTYTYPAQDNVSGNIVVKVEVEPAEYTVSYSWSGLKGSNPWTDGEGVEHEATLPNGGAAYEVKAGETFVVDTTYAEGSTFQNEYGTWTFSGWDTGDFEVTGDATIKGTWTIEEGDEATYEVSYSWSGLKGSNPWTDGEGVEHEATLPNGGAAYEVKAGETFVVDTTYAEGSTFQNEYGTWTFSGWDTGDFEVTGDATIKGTWTLTNIDISGPEVTVNSPQDVLYNGADQTWVPTVTDGEKVLVAGRDYEVSYSTDDRTNVTGTITVTITGKVDAGYTGSVTRTYQILPLTITVTPRDIRKTQGQADPTLTSDYSGYLSGETAGWTGALTREPGEAVGTYTIYQGSLRLADNPDGNFLAQNYDLVVNEGTFTIVAAPVTPDGGGDTPTPTPGGGGDGTPTPGTPATVTPADDTTTDEAAPEETIADDENALAAPTDTIGDDDTPLAAGAKDEDCWVHWLILLGMILSAVYFVGVGVRRRKFTSSLLGYEDKVLGNDRDNA